MSIELISVLKSSPTIMVLVAAGVALLLWEMTVRWRMAGYRTPKGFVNLPFVGHGLTVLKHAASNDLVDVMYRFSKDASFKTLGFRTFGQVWVSGSTAKHVEHVFGPKFTNYDKGEQFNFAFRQVLGDSIFTTDGERWKEHRRVASHLFTAQQLRVRMRIVFERRAKQMVEELRKTAAKGPFDLQPFFYRYTFDTINEIAFGRAVNSLGGDARDIAFQEAFDRAQARVARRVLVPEMLWTAQRALGLGEEAQMKKDVEFINSYLAAVIKDRAEGGEAEGDGQDLISLFIESCEREGRSFEQEELRDLIMSFVIAGRDTTASLLTWTFYLLSVNKPMMERARQETREKDGDYDAMSWTQAVLQEALRLYPSVPLEFKTAREDDTLPCGTKVHAGSRVMYNPFVVLRNPANFEEPEKFTPHRWMDADGSCKKYDMQGFSYPAFNAGPRVCLGRAMAMMEAKVVVGHLLDDFDFSLEPGFEPSTKFTVVLAARHGMRVNATPLY
eukprot:Hpha_TRINITY_DN14915_c0_g2::TRINITY_DN14915_c0_g2_i1::g.144440::m.144440